MGIYFLTMLKFIFYIFLLYKINDGRNWARITYLVLFIIALLFVVPFYVILFEVYDHNKFIIIISLTTISMILYLISLLKIFSLETPIWIRKLKVQRNKEFKSIK